MCGNYASVFVPVRRNGVVKKITSVKGLVRMAYDFDGEKYRKASSGQKTWGSSVISGLSLHGTEHILDLGCGDGVLTLKLAEAVPDGYVTGVDASPGMIAAARQFTPNNLRFIHMDINDLNFHNEYDLIFSNAALHWVHNHRNLLDRSYAALKQDGLIRWTFGGFGNCPNLNGALLEAIELPRFRGLFSGYQWPWYLPNVLEYENLLANAHFNIHSVSLDTDKRLFSDTDAIVRWIEQPCLVPFLDFIQDERDKKDFHDVVVNEILRRTKKGDGTHLEIFKLLNVTAAKSPTV